MTAVGDKAHLNIEDDGYHKSLKPRQLQMIAIGGAIGTGLFLGAGGRLERGTRSFSGVRGVRGLRILHSARAR